MSDRLEREQHILSAFAFKLCNRCDRGCRRCRHPSQPLTWKLLDWHGFSAVVLLARRLLPLTDPLVARGARVLRAGCCYAVERVAGHEFRRSLRCRARRCARAAAAAAPTPAQAEHDSRDPGIHGCSSVASRRIGGGARVCSPRIESRRAFLRAVGASTALAAISQFFPLGTATEAFAQAARPRRRT